MSLFRAKHVYSQIVKKRVVCFITIITTTSNVNNVHCYIPRLYSKFIQKFIVLQRGYHLDN